MSSVYNCLPILQSTTMTLRYFYSKYRTI